mgnify:CR=1 FL=1
MASPLRPSADPGTRYIVLENGRRYEGRPGEHQFRIVEFAEHGIPYKVPAPREPDFDAEARSTDELLAARDLQAAAELQWRVSVPISALLLAFLAVPLAKSRPRHSMPGRQISKARQQEDRECFTTETLIRRASARTLKSG